MKKHFLWAALAILGFSACSNDEIQTRSGEDAMVSITANLTTNTGTRLAINETGDGTKVDRCVMQVYQKEGDQYVAYGEQKKADVSGLAAHFNNIRVVTGRTYKFVFWADKSDGAADKFYNTADLTNVTIKGDYTVNNDERDAFFGSKEVSVAGSSNESVVLTRPFAQVNLTTTDIASVQAADKPNKVKVTYTTAGYAALNALTGEVIGEQQKNVASAEADVMDAEGGYEVMDYLFVPAGEAETLVDFKTDFYNGSKLITTNSQTTNIPLKRNWRTNISGNLLTDGLNFHVTLNPGFEGEITPKEFVSETALNAGGYWVLNDPKDGSFWSLIDLTKVDPAKDLHLIINQKKAPVTIVIGNTKEITNNITIEVEDGAPTPTFVTNTTSLGKEYKATVLNNYTIVSRSSVATDKGFNTESLETVKNVTLKGLFFTKKGIRFVENIQNLSGLTIDNCHADALEASFLKVSARNSSDITVKDNIVGFAPFTDATPDRCDMAEIWYMNGGKLAITGNTCNGGWQCVTTIPAAAQKSPAETLIENNNFYPFGTGITIQYPENKIIIRNNDIRIAKVSSSAISFMLFKAANNPDVEVTGNRISVNPAATSYAVALFGWKTAWGDNEAGCKGKFVVKDNVKYGDKALDWKGWFAGQLSANAVTLSEGSDISKPYKN